MVAGKRWLAHDDSQHYRNHNRIAHARQPKTECKADQPTSTVRQEGAAFGLPQLYLASCAFVCSPQGRGFDFPRRGS